jgi:hypothetical protein
VVFWPSTQKIFKNKTIKLFTSVNICCVDGQNITNHDTQQDPNNKDDLRCAYASLHTSAFSLLNNVSRIYAVYGI